MTPTFLMLVLAAAAPVPNEEVNALNLLSGTREVDADGQRFTDGDPEALLDGSEWAWEPSPTMRRQVIFQLAEPYDLTSGEALNSHNEPGWPGLSVKQLRLETAAKPGGPWQPLAEVTLEKKTAPQKFKAVSKAVRYVRVSLLTNYGNAEWFGIDELSLFGRRSQPKPADFNGAWDTGYGELKLTQTGQRIWGCYGGDGSGKAGAYTVEGTLEGAVFAGSWKELNSEGGSDDGLMVFALTSEGGLSGVWGRGSDPKDRTRRWDGTRKPKATIVCELPEKSLGRDLAANGRVVLRGILFDTGKDVIRPESKPVLEELAAAMKATPDKAYVIEGHTDDRGGRDYNQALSEKRAASVKAWLLKAGVTAGLKTVGFGMSKPAAPNTSDGGRAANRRVEVAAQ